MAQEEKHVEETYGFVPKASFVVALGTLGSSFAELSTSTTMTTLLSGGRKLSGRSKDMSSFSLLLLLRGPMQSWGDESRYTTELQPRLPVNLVLLDCLQQPRVDGEVTLLKDLTKLKLAVRVDQSGTLLRDYQTAQPWQINPQANATLVTRYFLSDASFLVAIESPHREILEGLAHALNHPAFPLFLGRRSCPVSADLVQGIVDEPAVQALHNHEKWHASTAYKKSRSRHVKLPIYRDAEPGEIGDLRHDVPLSFSSEHRQYGWRTVIEDAPKIVVNELGTEHDPFFEAVISV